MKYIRKRRRENERRKDGHNRWRGILILFIVTQMVSSDSFYFIHVK